jgi:hypothetical protein
MSGLLQPAVRIALNISPRSTGAPPLPHPRLQLSVVPSPRSASAPPRAQRRGPVFSAQRGSAPAAAPADGPRVCAIFGRELALAHRAFDDGMGGELLPGAGHYVVQRRPTARAVEE